MIYDIIIQTLKSDTEIASTVSTFNSSPAIFGDMAPEKAVLPYIVIRCFDIKPTSDKALTSGIMDIDIYDYGTSFLNCDKIRNRIELLTDNKIFNNDKLSDIRINMINEGAIPDEDITVLHYNIEFTFRAIRKSWTINKTNN